MWVYGIKLILTEQKSDNSKGMFDLDVINNYLSNTTQIRPERIEMAKKVLESFTSADCNSFGDDMNTCLQKFGAMNWSLGSNRIPENNKISETSKVDGKLECNGTSVTMDSELKRYIDEQFTSIEKRLMEKIELMDKNINHKLDAILSQLESNVQ